MKDFKPQLKKILKKCWQWADKITLLVSGIIIIIVLVFLYNNFYQTVGDAAVLLKLKGQVTLEMVDMEKWEKINKEIEWKKQPLAEEGLTRNPFE